MIGETKTKISEVALRLFSQNGYPGTSMSDIAAQLGITKPALYKRPPVRELVTPRPR